MPLLSPTPPALGTPALADAAQQLGEWVAPLHRLTYSGVENVYMVAPNPSGPTAYVQVSIYCFDPFRAALVHWPWTVSVFALVVVVVMAVRARRVLARPQRLGAPHCRKCNYDLSGTACERGDGTPCTECGRALTARRIVVGRSRRRRLVRALALPGVMLAATGVFACVLAVRWTYIERPRWPSPTLHGLIESLGMVVAQEVKSSGGRIDEIDLATGGRVRTVIGNLDAYSAMGVTPSGDAFVVADAFDGRFRLISTRSGRTVREVELPEREEAIRTSGGVGVSRPVIGFSSDGSCVFVIDPILYDAVTAMKVWRWNLRDGTLSLEAMVELERRQSTYTGPSGATETTWYPEPPGLAVVGDRVASFRPTGQSNQVGAYSWAPPGAPIVRPARPPGKVVVHGRAGAGGGGGGGEADVHVGLAGPQRLSCSLAVTRDGAWGIGATDAGLVEIDFVGVDAGEPIAGPPENLVDDDIALDPEGRLVAVCVSAPNARPGIALYDRTARAWVGRLGGSVWEPYFSGDGRYVMGIGLDPPTAPRPAIPTSEIVIWDLAPVRERIGATGR